MHQAFGRDDAARNSDGRRVRSANQDHGGDRRRLIRCVNRLLQRTLGKARKNKNRGVR